MPVFHPTMPSMTLKPLHRPDLTAKAAPPVFVSVTAPAPLPGTISKDMSITPAAPPSAVQMQIKALLSEQALSLEADKQDRSDT